jgi:LysR family transcriptional regulator, nitrogen assimilation regulatory protein
MDLKQLNYFLCLAREGNMTRAARQLNIVQPALSMQIAKLERNFGKQLFDRTAHGVSLTPAGETLVRLAGTIGRKLIAPGRKWHASTAGYRAASASA